MVALLTAFPMDASVVFRVSASLLTSTVVAVAWTDLIRPSALNELRAGFSRDFAHSDPVGLTVGKSLASDYGLNGIPAGPMDAGIPPINISGLTRLGSSPWRPASTW